jgi:hypothetical protein
MSQQPKIIGPTQDGDVHPIYQSAQGHPRAKEDTNAARYLLSKPMADDGRSNKGQHEERD